MALATRTHIIPQLLRNNPIVCLHFLIYKLPTNNNGCVLVGWCNVSKFDDSGELPPMLHTWQIRHGQATKFVYSSYVYNMVLLS